MYENERLLRIHGDWCRILSGLSTTESMADINWDYSVLHGPEKWSEHCEIGKKQSPINIETAEVRYDQSLLANPLSMDCRGVYLNVRNLGVNISAAYANKSLNALLLSGGPLRHTYQFREMHLHWGKCADRGSEHRINGKCFSAELHLVHWNRDLYETELEAIKSPLGLSVLGIFLDSSTDAHNESLEQLLRMFEKVEFKDDSYMTDDELIPYSVMPTNTHDYYTYDGSLTTPPCYESVKWIVFANAVPVSQKQLERLRLLKAVGRNDGKGGNFRDPFGTCISSCTCIEPPCIGDNCRPVMEVNERVVLSSFPVL